MVAQEVPQARPHLECFAQYLSGKTNEQLEETFCHTFDNNQTAALEVGWHVFGESYERGAFLVKMRELLRDSGLSEGQELPDHMSHVLSVLGTIDEGLARDLAVNAAAPAAKKICVSLAAGDNPYESVLDAVLEVLNLVVQEPNGCTDHE